MKMSFSSKYHTFTLTSCTPLSLSSIRVIRRQFLSCAYNMRPPGVVRSKRKLKKLGLVQIHSPRFVFASSSGSHTLLVVVVAVVMITVSAASLAYFNFKHRKKNSQQFPDRQAYALPQGENGQVILSQVQGIEEPELLGKGRELLQENDRQESYIFENEEVHLSVSTSSSRPEELIMSTALNSSVSGTVATIDDRSSFATRLEVIDHPVLVNSAVLEPLAFCDDTTQLETEESRNNVIYEYELRRLMERNSNKNSAIEVEPALPKLTEYSEEKGDYYKVDEVISYDVIFGESFREDLYSFYEVKKSATGFNPSNSLQSASHYPSFSRKDEFSSSFDSTKTLNGSGSVTKTSNQIAGCVERNVPKGSYKREHLPDEGSQYLRKDNGFRGVWEKDLLNGKGHFARKNQKHIDVKFQISDILSVYNRFVREGRLFECVEFLKDMETKGLLDMDKVYHSKFFNLCKQQKAVKEAFDYIKLIRDPKISTFNMLMSVCTSSQDSEGAFEVLKLVQKAGLNPDCKLYTTLISACAKSGKVDNMFEVFHEMVNLGVEPNVHTYGALIDGCARAGQVAKAFGAYGLLRSKKVKPDRVVFNALITACGQSGAVDRAFDVLAEMADEARPIEPDEFTVGALIKACANAGQVDRAREVYRMMHEHNIKGTPEVYTIAVHSCSQTADWEFARNVYSDMTSKGVVPDEMFLSALVDVAGHAGKLDAAFSLLREARSQGIQVGIMPYSSLMGACSNTKNWQTALELYEDLKTMKLLKNVSTVNALITALCEGDQFDKAKKVFSETKRLGLRPNTITYTVLVIATEKKDDLESALLFLSQAKKDGVSPNLVMCRCIAGMCFRRFEEARSLGEPALSFDSGRPQVTNNWTSVALMVYRETIVAGEKPTIEVLSQILGCLHLPSDASLKSRLIENLGVISDKSRSSNLSSLIDGFGEYDPRAFSLLEEAASLGLVPSVSFKESPVVVDTKMMQVYVAEVYFLTVLKGLKHRLAAGARVPNVIILLPVEQSTVQTPKGERTIQIAGRVGQAVASLLRRLGIVYLGSESYGKIRINGITLRKWFQPKIESRFTGKPGEWSSSQLHLGKGIINQQRQIRTVYLSLE